MTQTLEQNNQTLAIEAIQTWMVNQIAKQLSIPATNIKVEEPLTRYGLDSIDSVTIVGDMEEWLDTDLPSTLLWDYPSIAKAATYLVDEMGITPAGETVSQEATPEPEAAATGKGWGLWNRGR